MDFNYDGSLKNAIVAAATDHDLGELQETRRGFQFRMPTESTGYLLADITLGDGKKAQAHLVVTRNPDEFIGGESNIPHLDLNNDPWKQQ